MSSSDEAQALCHAFECAMRATYSRNSLRRDTEEAFRTAAAFRGRIAAVRLDVTLCLKTIKGGVDRSDGHLTFGASSISCRTVTP